MLKCTEIKTVLFSQGTHTGVPFDVVDTVSKDAVEVELDEVFAQLLNSRRKEVLVKGHLSKTPELKTLIHGLVSKGKKVVFMTSASEEIVPIRSIRGLQLFLVMVPPTSKKNDVNLRTLTYLQPGDELKVNITCLKDYQDAVSYLRSKTITNPKVLFSISADCVEVPEITSAYLQDSVGLGYANALTTGLKF